MFWEFPCNKGNWFSNISKILLLHLYWPSWYSMFQIWCKSIYGRFLVVLSLALSADRHLVNKTFMSWTQKWDISTKISISIIIFVTITILSLHYSRLYWEGKRTNSKFYFILIKLKLYWLKGKCSLYSMKKYNLNNIVIKCLSKPQNVLYDSYVKTWPYRGRQ